MGIISKIRNWSKSSSSKSNDGSFNNLDVRDLRAFMGNDSKGNIKYSSNENYLKTAYGVNPAVFMVVDKIATISSRLPRILTDLDKKDKEIQINDLNELLEKPNSKEGFEQTYYRIASTYLVLGEVFIMGTSANIEDEKKTYNGDIHDITVPIATNVTIHVNNSNDVIGYTVNESGTIRNYEPSQVLHIKKPDITEDNNRGFSPLRPSKVVWVTDSENWKNEYSLLKTSGIRGVLYIDGGRIMAEKEQKALQDRYDKEYGNSNVFGKVRIDTQKLGFLDMAVKPKDMMSDEARWSYLRYICGVFGMDSKLFNDPKASTNNNYETAKLAMYTDVILPLSKMIDEEITRWLIKGNYNEFNTILTVDLETIVILNQPNKILSAKVVNEVKQGIITVEEAKEILYPNGVK